MTKRSDKIYFCDKCMKSADRLALDRLGCGFFIGCAFMMLFYTILALAGVIC